MKLRWCLKMPTSHFEQRATNVASTLQGRVPEAQASGLQVMENNIELKLLMAESCLPLP